MRRVFLKLTLLAAGLAGLAVSPASAVVKRADLGLAQSAPACTGKGLYGYDLRWRAGPRASFQVNSGNGCQMSGVECSISGKGCVVDCSPQGVCTAAVARCVIGKGAPWIRVTARDRSVFQQITAPGPGRCQ
jgi:hypothetical protein